MAAINVVGGSGRVSERVEGQPVDGDRDLGFRRGSTQAMPPTRARKAKTVAARPRDSLLRLVFVGAVLVSAGRARAQVPTIDTSIPALPGSGTSAMGRIPGAGGGTFSNLPGEGGILSGRPGVSFPKGIPTSVTMPGTAPE